MSPTKWSTRVEVRHYDPATGLTLKVTVERDLPPGAVVPETGQHERVAAKVAALHAFRALDLDALATPEALEGTDVNTRLHISADPNYSR